MTDSTIITPRYENEYLRVMMGIIINVMMRHVVTAYICNHAMIWQGFLTRDLIYSTYFFLVIVSWFSIEISFFMHEHISYKNIIIKTLYPMFLKMFNGFDNFNTEWNDTLLKFWSCVYSSKPAGSSTPSTDDYCYCHMQCVSSHDALF